MALFLGFRVVLTPPGVSSGIELLLLGFEVVFRDSCRDRPEWYFWDFQWYSLNGTVAPLNGIEWYCGPLSGVSSGIEALFLGLAW